MAEKGGSTRRRPASADAEPSEGSGPAPEVAEDEIAFEEAYRRLEAVVDRLEGGEPTLEESLRLLEEGIRMSRICQRRLDQAQARMEQLLDRNGELVTEPFELGSHEGVTGAL